MSRKIKSRLSSKVGSGRLTEASRRCDAFCIPGTSKHTPGGVSLVVSTILPTATPTYIYVLLRPVLMESR